MTHCTPAYANFRKSRQKAITSFAAHFRDAIRTSKTSEEAVENIRAAIELHVETRVEDGDSRGGHLLQAHQDSCLSPGSLPRRQSDVVGARERQPGIRVRPGRGIIQGLKISVKELAKS